MVSVTASEELPTQVINQAHHGSSLRNCEEIANNGFHEPEDNGGYLGRGVYFYENCRACAIWWAGRKFAGEEIGVVEATVDLGVCLDFQDTENAEAARAARELLKAKYDREGRRDPINLEDVITYMVARDTTITSIRYTQVPEKREWLMPRSRIVYQTRTVICIRHIKDISNPRLVYPER